MARYPTSLQQIILFLRKFPGVGTKSAERLTFHLLTWQPSELSSFASLLSHLRESITQCPDCQCLMEKVCPFCKDTGRDATQLCIISSPKDVFAIEETGSFKGLYHVIGALLSPIEGKSIEHLQLDKLKKRLSTHPIKEIIIALDSTLEGDTTSLYLKEFIDRLNIPISRLAFGLPLGSSLDFVDGGTLARALLGRHVF